VFINIEMEDKEDKVNEEDDVKGMKSWKKMRGIV
jgi:hypothetical protein